MCHAGPTASPGSELLTSKEEAEGVARWVEHDAQSCRVAISWLVRGFCSTASQDEPHSGLKVVDHDLEVHHLPLTPGLLGPNRWFVPLLSLQIDANTAVRVAQLHPSGVVTSGDSPAEQARVERAERLSIGAVDRDRRPGDRRRRGHGASLALAVVGRRFPGALGGVGRAERIDDPGRSVGSGHSIVTIREDVPVGWEALDQWGGDVARVERFQTGVANEVWSVRVNGRLAVARLGRRSDADLAWETDLLRHLDRGGMSVPVPLPTEDGRAFVDGIVVMTDVEGGPPETEADWCRVADTLRQLHGLTQDWPQRPGWRSSIDLLRVKTATRVNLDAMPSEGVVRCREAWARLAGRERCVIHGDTNPGNVRMTADQVTLIDWDESHVDVPDLDLVLPHNSAGLDDDAHDAAAQAKAAWEAAVCWDPSGTDQFAVDRLAEVREV
jgi:aminoglycoside phosphotransferase (APT) family kinase protein